MNEDKQKRNDNRKERYEIYISWRYKSLGKIKECKMCSLYDLRVEVSCRAKLR